MTQRARIDDGDIEVEGVGLDLRVLTPLELDLWVACSWDLRPPQGLAGLCDWRLNGRISRELKRGRVDLGMGEVTLIGAPRRLGGARLALVGLGPIRAEGPRVGNLQRVAEAVAARVRQIRSRRVAVEIPLDPRDPNFVDPLVDPERSIFVTPLMDALGAGGEGRVERLVLVSRDPPASKKNLSEPGF